MEQAWPIWFLFVVLVLAVGYYARSYYALRARHQKCGDVQGELALEIHRNRVLADRAEQAERKLAFDEKQIDALLLLPQSRCSDGALRRPTVAVIRDEEGHA